MHSLPETYTLLGLLLGLGAVGFIVGFFMIKNDFMAMMKGLGIPLAIVGGGTGLAFFFVAMTDDGCGGAFALLFGIIVTIATAGGLLILLVSMFLGRFVGKQIWNDEDPPILENSGEYQIKNK